MADLAGLDGVQGPRDDPVAAAEEAAPVAEAPAEAVPQAKALVTSEEAAAAPQATEEQELEAAAAPVAAPDSSEEAAAAAPPAATAAPEAAAAAADSSSSSEAPAKVEEEQPAEPTPAPVPVPESESAAPSNAAKQGKQGKRAKAKAAANSSSAEPGSTPAAAPAEEAAPEAAKPAPAAAAADAERELIKFTNEKEVPPKQTVKVAELRQTLSGSGAALTGGLALPPAPSPARERPPSPALSPHDAVNTTNVAALLQASEFRLKPGVDEVAYEALVGLRLEDGIDVTRKEEYLSGDEFAKVMGVTKDAFAKLPAWKRLQKKRDVNLF